MTFLYKKIRTRLEIRSVFFSYSLQVEVASRKDDEGPDEEVVSY